MLLPSCCPPMSSHRGLPFRRSRLPADSTYGPNLQKAACRRSTLGTCATTPTSSSASPTAVGTGCAPTVGLCSSSPPRRSSGRPRPRCDWPTLRSPKQGADRPRGFRLSVDPGSGARSRPARYRRGDPAQRRGRPALAGGPSDVGRSAAGRPPARLGDPSPLVRHHLPRRCRPAPHADGPQPQGTAVEVDATLPAVHGACADRRGPHQALDTAVLSELAA